MAFQRSEIFLIIMIVLFFSFALLFIILLVISRLRKIKALKQKTIYDLVIGKLLFLVIFENRSSFDLLIEEEYASNIENKVFRQLLLDAVIKLHKSYTGEYAKTIETFYYESSLIDDTYRKLKSRSWSAKCGAIRELAEMNIESAYSLIDKYVYAKNLILRQEAITAIVKLKGVDGLSFLYDYKETLSNWMQVNLLSILRNLPKSSQAPDYNLFITSSNNSVTIFGKKLKAYFEQNNETFSENENTAAFLSENKTLIDNSDVKEQGIISDYLKQKFYSIMFLCFKRIFILSAALFLCFLITHSYEIITNKILFTTSVIYYSILNDIYAVSLLALYIFPITFATAIFWKKAANFLTSIIYFSLISFHLFLTVCFFKSKAILGINLFNYSFGDILILIKGNGGFNYLLAAVLLLTITVLGIFVYYINKSSFLFFQKTKLSVLLLIAVFSISNLLRKEKIERLNEYENYLVNNKSFFFFESILGKQSDIDEDKFTDDKLYYLTSPSDSIEKPIVVNSVLPSHIVKKNTATDKSAEFSPKNTESNTEKKSSIDEILAKSDSAKAEVNRIKKESEKIKTSETAQQNKGPKIAVHALKNDNFSDEKGKPVSNGFYVIIGTFGNKKNADRCKTVNINKGHNKTKMIQNKTTKVYNIFVLETDKIDDIITAKYKEEYPGVWILKLE